MSRIAALGAWLAVVAAISGCAGNGRQAALREPAAAPAAETSTAFQTDLVELPVPSGCSVPDHQPSPADGAQTRPDVAPEPITKVPPSYPQAARERNISGLVRLRVLVCEHGRVVKAKAVESVPELDQAAAEALVQWTFKPALRGGQPVAAWVEEPVRFTIH